MSVNWMLMILLGCRFSHATESLSSCACNDHLETVSVPAGASVSVPCPKLRAEDVTFNLVKNTQVISKYMCVLENSTSQCKLKTANTSMDLALRENQDDGSFSFALAAVTANHSAHYSCEATITFPPPFLRVCNTSKVLLLVEGHQCKHGEPGSGNQTHRWIWILGLVALSIYSTIVTFIALICWHRMRRMECQSDYVNTKPRAPRGHRKRGILYPLPRHF